jgi:hypothetical protein
MYCAKSMFGRMAVRSSTNHVRKNAAAFSA